MPDVRERPSHRNQEDQDEWRKLLVEDAIDKEHQGRNVQRSKRNADCESPQAAPIKFGNGHGDFLSTGSKSAELHESVQSRIRRNSKLLWVWEPDISERHPSFEDCDRQLAVDDGNEEAGLPGLMLEVKQALFAGGNSLGMVLRSQQSHADQPLAKRRAADLHITPHFGIWDFKLVTLALRTDGANENWTETPLPAACGTLDVLFPSLLVPSIAFVTSAKTGAT